MNTKNLIIFSYEQSGQILKFYLALPTTISYLRLVSSAPKQHVVVKTEWAKFITTFKPSNKDFYLTFGIDSIGSSWVSSIKLERGNVATSWSASPADTKDKINSEINKKLTAYLSIEDDEVYINYDLGGK